ncbi:MAG: NAD(P)H-dependent flavin oxidoreductase [Thermodesulfobacteriota bacterium]
MWPKKTVQLLKQWEIIHPIIQAPMAGGITTPELISTVSETGAIGSIGAGYLTPGILEAEIQDVKRLTDKPYNVNLFITGEGKTDFTPPREIKEVLEKYAEELGIPFNVSDLNFPDFDEQFEVVIENKVPVFSFTFGFPEKKYIDELKRNKIKIIGTATSVREAVQLEEIGCDAVVAQGFEAGGHRGSFIYENGLPLVGSIALIPQIADKISIPVIASGAIMDGRGIIAALILGASAVQLGTAFLGCKEGNVNDRWLEGLFNSSDTTTDLTNAFTGKYARGLKNRFMDEMKQYESLIPEYPVQNQLTRDIRAKAREENNKDFMSYWAGQGSAMCKSTTSKELINSLVKECESVLSGLKTG